MPPTKSMASEKVAPLGSGHGSTALPVDRVLPNSFDAEVAVLGAMLLSPQDAGSQARERLSEQHFYHAPHRVIFREIAALQDALHAVDQVTLVQRLADKKQLDDVGGAAYLVDLINRVPTTANLEHYIDIVWEKYLLRQLIEAAYGIIGKSFDEQDDVKGWLDEVQQQIFDISSEKDVSGPRPVGDFIKDAMHSIEQLYDTSGKATGVATGFRDLDKLTSGLHPGNLVIIAGRPSMGKTSLAMNIAENVALDYNLPVGVFSLEMSSEELVKRILCSRAKVNLRSVRDGFLADRHFHELTSVASQLMKAKLFVDDSAGLTVNQVRARARRMKLQHDVQLIVVDYLQLMRAPSRRADLSRQTEVADISAGLKALAKELNIPIIVLSQLNRQPESRDEGKPRLSDLRESGSIEQDADLVGLLVRPEVYEDDEDRRATLKGKATLIIAKQRNGPTGDVNLTFLNEYTRFEDAARIESGDIPDGERDAE
jgi:replicative DNA helicase